MTTVTDTEGGKCSPAVKCPVAAFIQKDLAMYLPVQADQELFQCVLKEDGLVHWSQITKTVEKPVCLSLNPKSSCPHFDFNRQYLRVRVAVAVVLRSCSNMLFFADVV